jgi:mannose-1-phosphate guanylyltransferase
MIMAGGAGTRLWPMSRRDRPKQLLPFIGGRSLLEVAVKRLEGVVPPTQRCICTGESFREAIREALPDFTDDQILGEPEGRDTLAAVGFPAAVAVREDPDAVIAVFTADHLIEPVEDFQRRVEVGYQVAEQHPNTLVTFGIKPTHPATGFGYVEMGEPLAGFDRAFQTVRFIEKPDAHTAAEYVASGRYAWNSGMFVWRAATLLDCIRRYKPAVHEGLVQIADAWGTDGQSMVLNEVYPTLEKISIDFAVMEPASTDEAVDVATVSMPLDWLDVGSWPAYGQTLEADEAGNRVACDRAVLLDSNNNLIVGDDPNHLIAAVGIDDLVIVRTEGATLICHRDHAQKIKQLHEVVGRKFGEEHL